MVAKKKTTKKPIKIKSLNVKILGKFGSVDEKRSMLESAQKAYKEAITVTLHGKPFTVYPTRAAMVMKAYSRTKPRGSRSQYDPNNWLKLNDKYQLLLGNGWGYNKEDVCTGAGMKVFDTAVPQQWLDRPENMNKWRDGEWAVWSYDGKDRSFGRPVWKTEVFRNLKKNLLAALR